jgi:cell division protein FtsL
MMDSSCASRRKLITWGQKVVMVMVMVVVVVVVVVVVMLVVILMMMKEMIMNIMDNKCTSRRKPNNFHACVCVSVSVNECL